MILVWLGLFVSYLMAGAIYLPPETFARDRATRKGWQHYAALVLFYSIPASGLAEEILPSPLVAIVAMTLFYIGGALNLWAIRSNPYFSPEIVTPPRVVTDGAYRWLNHPGYTGMMLMALASWLLVGAQWALIPLALYGALLAWRARKETQILAA